MYMTRGSGRRPKDWQPACIGDRFGSLIITRLDHNFAHVQCDCGGVGRWPLTWLGRPKISTKCEGSCPASTSPNLEYSLHHLYGLLRLRASDVAWNKTPTKVSLTFKQFVEIRSGARCYYCDEYLDGRGALTRPTFIGLDRINARRGYHIDNVLPACAMCNTARGSLLSVEEFKTAMAVRLAKLLPGKSAWEGYERKAMRID